MRILLYGMQSSGASLITYFLGQRQRSVALVDIWIRHLTPLLPSGDSDAVVAKCTVSALFEFDDHARSFRPDRTVLVLRDPAQNYASLVTKGYVAEGGPIDEKFSRMEAVFRNRNQFDLTVAYEDFVAHPESTLAKFAGAGIPVAPEHYEFLRSVDEMKAFNFAHHPWCREQYGFRWGFGNVQGTKLNPRKLYRSVSEEVRAHVRSLCPSLYQHYADDYAWLASIPADPGNAAAQAPTRNGRWRDFVPGLRSLSGS